MVVVVRGERAHRLQLGLSQAHGARGAGRLDQGCVDAPAAHVDQHDQFDARVGLEAVGGQPLVHGVQQQRADAVSPPPPVPAAGPRSANTSSVLDSISEKCSGVRSGASVLVAPSCEGKMEMWSGLFWSERRSAGVSAKAWPETAAMGRGG